MKLTEDIIRQLTEALRMKNKKGEEIWEDGDEISVNIAGTFVADKFITLTNKTKNPVVSSQPHPDFDYEKGEWKEKPRLKPGEYNNKEIKSFNGISVALLSGTLGKHYMKDWTEEQINEWKEYVKGEK